VSLYSFISYLTKLKGELCASDSARIRSLVYQIRSGSQQVGECSTESRKLTYEELVTVRLSVIEDKGRDVLFRVPGLIACE